MSPHTADGDRQDSGREMRLQASRGIQDSEREREAGVQKEWQRKIESDSRSERKTQRES